MTSRSRNCRRMYDEYKEVCEIADHLEKCQELDFAAMTITQLKKFVSDLLYRYEQFLECAKRRLQFQRRCVRQEDVDEGHLYQIYKYEDIAGWCRDVLEEAKSALEEKRAEKIFMERFG